jgi:hypothetical protein
MSGQEVELTLPVRSHGSGFTPNLHEDKRAQSAGLLLEHLQKQEIRPELFKKYNLARVDIW